MRHRLTRLHVLVATFSVLALLVACGGGKINESCVELTPSMFDTSCHVDSDCVSASLGNLCDNGCLCGGAAINVADQARYNQLASQVPPGVGCGCPFLGAPTCVAGQCVVCGGAAQSPPGCPDAGQ